MVLGTTTPFYALLLGFMGLFFPDIVLTGYWIGVLAWVATAWLAMLYLWKEGYPRAGMIAAFFVGFQPAFYLSLGMETALLVALMLAVAWAWLENRTFLAVILAAILLLTRQDSALWLFFVGLAVWQRRKKLPWQEAMAVVWLTFPWFVYAQWRYGSILPNSAGAKIGQFQKMLVAGEILFPINLAHMWVSGLPDWVGVVLVTAVTLTIWMTIRKDNRFWWLISWLVIYVTIYTMLGVVNFTWYFVPVLTILNVLAAMGLGFLLGDGESLFGADVWLRDKQPYRLLLMGFYDCFFVVCWLVSLARNENCAKPRGSPF